MTRHLLRLLLATTLVGASAAPVAAQVLTTYNNGDVFLGFRRAGTASTLAVNIGSARQFLTSAQGGTNDSTAPFKVRFGVVPNTGTAVTNLSTDLAAVFGSTWATNKTDGTGVRWGVVGISGNTSSGIPGYTARTLFVTRARTAPGTPTSIPADRLEVGDYDSFSSAFTSFVQGTGGSQYRSQQSTTNSSAAYIGAASGPDNWGTRINEASDGSFGLGSGYEVEQTFGPFSGPTDSVLDLWISPNDGSTPIPVDQNTYLGFFTLSTAGELTFTPAASVAAPAITGFTPTTGSAGTSVVITGAGLSGATSVTFNGVTAAITANTATQITATVPASATTGKIAVSTAGGTATSTADFTVTAPVPILSNFTPLSGAIGTSVVITGANLSGANSVSFNGVNAPNFTVDSATQITAIVPAGAATGKVAVTTAGGTATSFADFTVTVPVNPALTTYANGDVFLGFRRTGTAETLAVNLGSARQFLTTTQGGTNDTAAPFKVRFGVVPGGSTAVNNLAADLTTVFGSNWATNKADGSSVRWAVVGLSGNTSSGIAGYTARTLFVTRARTATNTPTIVPADRLEIGDFDSFSSAFDAFVQGVGGGSYKNQFSTLNSSVAYIGSAADDNNWGTRINEAAEGSFGLGANLEVEQTFGSFSGPTDSVLDLWISPNTGSTAIPVNQNTYLGFFTLSTAGELTFTPAAATAPPTITGFTPSSGPIGASVVITGTRLTGATSVTFNGVSATTFTVNSPTQITATVPATATTGKIAVATPNGSVTSTNNYTVTLPPPVISSATTASGKIGQAFSYLIIASNGPTSFNAPGLPAGLSINTTTGLISGTPTQAGTFSVAISATNSAGTATATLVLEIPAPPVITSTNAASGQLGNSFLYQITASNNPTSYAVNGSLPTGVSLNTNTGLISGTPSQAGTFTVTVSATNAGGTGSATLTLTVAPRPLPIVDSATQSGRVGQNFAFGIVASNAPQSYTARNLPAGLTINARTGQISGIPTQAGTFTVAISATNSTGTGSGTLTLIIAARPIPVVTSETISGRVAQNFWYQIKASEAPQSYAAQNLPAGLTLNRTTGVITGTPTQFGKFTVAISATNSTGAGNGTLTIDTAQQPAPIVTPANQAGRVGLNFSYRIVASNTPRFFGAQGLPAGLTINTATGQISGIPTRAGTFTVTTSATNAGGTGTGTLTLNIAALPSPPVITPPPAPLTGRLGQAFTYQVAASNAPTSYRVGSGAWPVWLRLNTTTGQVSGTPNARGNFTFTVIASNAGGSSAPVTIRVNVP